MSDLDNTILMTAVPSMVNNAVVPLVNSVDTFWVGRMGLALSLAGQTAANGAFFYLYFLVSFLPVITAPLVAAAVGSGDEQAAQDRVCESLFLCNVLGGIGTLMLVGFPRRTLQMVLPPGAPAMDFAVPYLRLRGLSMIPALMASTGFAAYRGLLDTVTPLKVSLFTNGLNLVLDPLLIYTFSMGYRGAGFATAVAEILSGAIYIRLLLRKKLATWNRIFRFPSLKKLWPIIQGGSSILLRQIALNVSFMLAARRAQALDPSGVTAAAYGIVTQMYAVGIVVHVAMQGAAAALVSSTRAKVGDVEARKVANRMFLWGSIVGLGLGVTQFALLPVLVPLFSTLPEVQTAVRMPALIASALHVLNGPLFTGEGVMLGLKSYTALALCTLAAVATMATCVIGTSLGKKLVGLWASIGIFCAVRGVLVVLHHLRWGPLAPKNLAYQDQVKAFIDHKPDTDTDSDGSVDVSTDGSADASADGELDFTVGKDSTVSEPQIAEDVPPSVPSATSSKSRAGAGVIPRLAETFRSGLTSKRSKSSDDTANGESVVLKLNRTTQSQVEDPATTVPSDVEISNQNDDTASVAAAASVASQVVEPVGPSPTRAWVQNVLNRRNVQEQAPATISETVSVEDAASTTEGTTEETTDTKLTAKEPVVAEAPVQELAAQELTVKEVVVEEAPVEEATMGEPTLEDPTAEVVPVEEEVIDPTKSTSQESDFETISSAEPTEADVVEETVEEPSAEVLDTTSPLSTGVEVPPAVKTLKTVTTKTITTRKVVKKVPASAIASMPAPTASTNATKSEESGEPLCDFVKSVFQSFVGDDSDNKDDTAEKTNPGDVSVLAAATANEEESLEEGTILPEAAEVATSSEAVPVTTESVVIEEGEDPNVTVQTTVTVDETIVPAEEAVEESSSTTKTTVKKILKRTDGEGGENDETVIWNIIMDENDKDA